LQAIKTEKHQNFQIYAHNELYEIASERKTTLNTVRAKKL